MSSVARSAEVKFGFDNVLFMMRDFEDDTCLRGVTLDSTRKSFSEFSIPLRSGGAISDAVENRQIAFLNSGSAALSLAEDQLFRLLAAEHLVCLPLFASQSGPMGVIIAAVAAYRLDDLHARTSSLRTFASQAAIAIESVRTKAVESARITEKYRQASRWIVHEASNPLSIIKNYLAVLDAKVTRKEPVQAEVAILSQEIDRVSHILRGLTDVQIESPIEQLDIKQVVADVARFLMVTGFVPPSIQLETRLETEAADLKVDSNALKQILVNLIKNAVEAIQENGEIVVAIPGYINRDGRLYCAFTVRDNGPGIEPAMLAKLFSPVRSAKSGDHAGLGLSIVHGLVQKIGGIIMCRSDGNGTTFELLLPVDADAGVVVEDILQSRKSIGDNYGRN